MFAGMAISQQQAAANNANGGDLYRCINQIYKFCIVVASVVGVLFYSHCRIYLYVSQWRHRICSKAKNIIETTITAIVILLAGYVLLKAINPDLIQFQPIQPPSVTVINPVTPPTTSPTGTTQGTTSSSVATAAQTLIGMNGNKISIASSGCDCPNNCAINTLQSLAAGNQAQFDGPGSTCAAGYTNVSSQMLNGLINMANGGINFTISSLTGGHHSSATDPHYQGLAVDLVPSPSSTGAQQALVSGLQSNGATTIAIECVYSGASVYWPIPAQASASDGRCIGNSNYHIHAQWSN